MRCFDPTTSLLAGRSTVKLQADLDAAQQAYIDLSNGAKGENYSYTQGDGSRAVTYTKADLAALTMLIRTLQQQLGIIPRARRAIGVQA